MKKKILGLAIFLLGITPAFAADVAPLTFGQSASEDQQYWESLMKYKMWGTHGITFNKEKVYISETSGYSGTADGDVTLNNGYHSLGGPFLVGGDLLFSYPSAGVDYDSLYGGPVRVLGNLKLAQWYNATGTIYEGDYCIQGTAEATAGLNDGLAKWVSNAHKKGNVYASFAGADASYESCPPNVPKVDTHLSVPDWPVPGSASFDAGVVLTEGYAQTAYLDVPPILSENENEVFDRYIKEFTLKNNEHKYVYIRMPSKAQNYNHKNGRLTRFYVADGINIDKSVNSGIIQVVYVNEDATWNTSTKSWDNFNSSTAKYVPNKEYAGNVMFYTTKNITWEPLIAPSYQGTFMTTGTFRIEDHFVLAGQLVANNLWFESEITGDFRYVPFDPPVIDINPEARSWGVLKEGVSSAQALSVSLTEAPLTDVSFDYCYEFSGSQENNKLTDPDSSHAFASLDDVYASELPICNNNGENGTSTVKNTVHFDKGKVKPNESVLIRVANDSDEEWTEFFTIRIFNLLGAVLPNNDRDGKFQIEIDDDDKAPKGKDTVFVGVEDMDSPFSRFPATTGNGAALDEYEVKIESLPMKDGNVVGTLTYDGAVVDAATIAAGLVISSTDIEKLVYHGEDDAFGTDLASFTYRIISKEVSAVAVNTVTINLQAVNDAPTAFDTTYTIAELSTAGDVAEGEIRIHDVDDSRFTYAFDSDDPSFHIVDSLFVIDPQYGIISVKEDIVLNYETPDSVLTIAVKVTDAASTTGGVGQTTVSAQVTIKITDVNEAPIVSDKGPFSVDENAEANTVVGRVVATDPDIANPHYGTLSYSIDENEDGNDATNVPFSIAPDGTISVAEGANLDFETTPVWTIHVTVTDGLLPQGVEVVININDLNEPPHIDDILENYLVAENSPNGTLVTDPMIKITDPDAGDGESTLNVALEAFTASDAMAVTLFEAAVVKESDNSLRIKITVKDSEKLDYEALLANGADTVFYDVRLVLTDREGGEGSFADTAFTTIYVTDVNEMPSVEDAEFAVDENSAAGTTVGVVVASDPDTAHAIYGTLYYSLLDSTAGAAALFNIDNNGNITVAENAVLDYETMPVIYVKAVVTDNQYYDTATVKIALNDVNEQPELTCVAGDDKCNGPFDVFENSKKDSVIHEFAFVDVDAGDRGLLTTFVADANDKGADTLFTTKFNADSTIVQLVVKTGTNLDYEQLYASYVVVITVQDDEGLNDTLIRTINLIDVNEAPVLADRNFTPDENISNGDVIGEMVVDEPDTKNEEFRHLDYSIITPDMPFAMDGNKVVVTDAGALNFEIQSEFTFKVEVRNCEKNTTTGEYTEKCLADTADVKVTLQDVNENPEITCKVGDTNCNGPFDIDENSATGTVIHTFAISDVDADDTGLLTVTLSDNGTTGADSLFTVKVNDANTEVSIIVKDGAKLDYEKINPTHVVVITVADAAGLTDTLIRTINVVDVNETPVIADNDFTPNENLANGEVIGTMDVSEPDTKHVEEFGYLEYSIITPDMPFVMDSNSVKVADVSKLNFEVQSEFTFKVEVKNCEMNASTGEYTEKCLADTADVKITLQDVNENPEIKCFAGDANCNGPFAVDENAKTGSVIHPFAISDVDIADVGKLTAALSDNGTTGADSLFTVTLSATNDTVYVVVKDSAKLDYEKINPTHEVVITITDAAGLTDTLIRTINVNDVNETPTIADIEETKPENLAKGTVVAELSASDPDTKHVDEYAHLEYAVITENMPFVMDSNRVKVSDSTKIDYEITPVFVFQVEVRNCTKNASTGLYTEGCLADTASVTIKLTNVNEKPEIGCIAGDTNCNGPFKVDENSKTNFVIHTFAISDVDASDVLTVSLSDNGTTGADSLFDVVKNAAGTEVSIVVKDSSKLNYELIKDIHEVVITVKDADGLTDTLIRTIEVVDVNEAPVVEDFDKEIDENLPNGTVVGELVASDPDVKNDAFSTLTYKIVEQNVPFALDSNVIKVSDGDKLNYEKDSVFTFHVTVSDGEFTDTATVTIKLSDVNETPKIIVDDDDDGDDDTDDDCIANCDTTGRGHDPITQKTLTVGVEENVPTATIVFAYVLADEDFGEVDILTPSLKDNNGTGADSLFTVSVKPIDGKTKLVLSVKDSSRLDFEKINEKHEVTVYVTDPSGAKDSLVRIVQVIDVNEAPTVEDFDKKIDENLPNGTVVGELVAADPDVKNDAFSTLTYKIVEQNVPFTLDSNVIKVSDSEKLNYEKDSVFTFHAIVSDGVYSDTATVVISLKNVSEQPKIIVDDDEDGDDDTEDKCIANCDTTGRGHDPITKKTLTVGVEENSPTNTVVFSYVVADEDFGEVANLIPSLRDDENSGTDSLFKIEMKQDGGKWKVVVSVKDSAKLDYETIDPIHEVTVIVKDANGLQDSIKRIIEVIDVNEPPTFESWPFEFTEHNEPGTVVGHVEHGVDVDTTAISGKSIPENYIHDQFALTGGADGADTLFTLLPNGDLVANKRFNFETDPTEYTIYISLMDTLMPELVETDTIHITLLDVNEKPWIETDTVQVDENAKKGTVVDVIKAEDLDIYDSVLTFTLVEDNSGCFKVSKKGEIIVKADNCADLDYEKTTEIPIKVKVTDFKDASETKTIIVSINDVNEAPKIEDETIHVSEDAKVGTPIDTVAAKDPDTNPSYSELTYTIIDGDTSVFKIDPKTGVVTLKDSLDYEDKPEYTLVVEVNDGEFQDTAKVTIKIDNVVETPEVNITRAETKDSSWTNPDTLYINTTDICVDWMAKNSKSGTVLKDTTECMELEEGENVIVKKFDDPTMDFPGYDTLVVFVNRATPVVTVRKLVDDADSPNIFTVVEQSAKSDTSFYVNDPANDIVVTVMDPVSGSTEKFTMTVDLDTVSVPKKTFTTTMADIVDFSLALSDNPASTSRTPVNGEKIAVTYTEEVNGRQVQVTYYTDNDGEIIKNAEGNEEITVSYVTEINGREVTISYQADAVTGAVIKTTGGYAQSEDPTAESSSSGKNGSSSSGKGGKSSSSKGGDSKKDADKKVEKEVVFTVSYETVDETGNIMMISYGVDAEGNIVKNEDDNIGYLLTYTYKNKFGNSATQSLFIVLDQVPPTVKIVYPTEGEIIYSNYVDVKWTVDLGDGRGPIVQDTLITQGLKKGGNPIVRFYRDKAGNEASDTIRVIMKNAKDVDIAVEQPVTEVTLDKVAEYYATNEPEEGETFAVTIYNPKTDKEIETLVGGGYQTKKGSEEEPYPGLTGHLGPTLAIETKVPSINAVGGLATLDDIVNSDGLVLVDGVDADNSDKMPVDEYVDKYCTDAFAEKVGSDLSKLNLYKTKMYVKIWIYTSLGSFVDYYAFTQDLDNPDYVSDAALLTLFFEMKPDRDGNVRTETGRLMATGAYLYKTEVEMKSELQCTLPPVKDDTAKSSKKGATRSVKEDMLKSFGYKRPNKK